MWINLSEAPDYPASARKLLYVVHNWPIVLTLNLSLSLLSFLCFDEPEQADFVVKKVRTGGQKMWWYGDAYVAREIGIGFCLDRANESSPRKWMSACKMHRHLLGQATTMPLFFPQLSSLPVSLPAFALSSSLHPRVSNNVILKCTKFKNIESLIFMIKGMKITFIYSKIFGNLCCGKNWKDEEI